MFNQKITEHNYHSLNFHTQTSQVVSRHPDYSKNQNKTIIAANTKPFPQRHRNVSTAIDVIQPAKRMYFIWKVK